MAADDGLMPQTIEHFHILKSLGVKNGFVVLTKCDLVDEETVLIAEGEIRSLINSSFFEINPIIKFSSKDCRGKTEVIDKLLTCARNLSDKLPQQVLRYYIDRSFTLKGYGRIVTGLVTSGSIKTGEKVQIYPGDEITFVRRLHHHNEEVHMISKGKRSGINLSTKMDITRGMILGKPEELLRTNIINVLINVFDSAPRPLFHNEKVFVYHLSSKTQGRNILDHKKKLEPGDSCYGQIRLVSHIMPFYNDPLIIRFFQPDATAGCGIIIDTCPPKLRKGTLNYFERLKKLTEEGAPPIIIPLCRSCSKSVIELSRETGLTDTEIRIQLEKLKRAKIIVEIERDVYALSEEIGEAKKRITSSLNQVAKDDSLPGCMSAEELYSKLSPSYPMGFFRVALNRLAKEGFLEKDERNNFKLKSKFFSKKQEMLRRKILEQLENSPPVREAIILSIWNVNQKEIKSLLNNMIREGLIIRFKDGAVIGKDEFVIALNKIVDYLRSNREISVIEAKEILGWGRRSTISFLEHLDFMNITVRHGYTRTLNPKYLQKVRTGITGL